MAEITKQALVVDNNQSFPNNNNGQITPTVLRAFNTNMIDSTVNQIVYTADSASFNSQIAAISGAVAPDTGSLLVTASAVGNVMTFTKANASTFNVTVGSVIPTGTVSGSSQITALGFVSSSVTASSLVTASFSGNTLTFTKGDSSTFGVTIPDVSGSTIPAGTISGSEQITALGFVSSSVTGSFATTGSNTFTGNQTITGSVKNGIFFKTGSSEFFVGQDLSDNLIVSSSSQSKYIEFVKSNGWIEVNSSQVNFNNQVSLRSNTECRRITQEAGHPVIINGTLSASLQDGYAFVGGADGFSKQVPTASFAGAVPIGTATTGSNTFNGDQTISGSLSISGSLTASLQEGYAWVGGVGNVSTLVPTSSFGGGGSTDTGSLMTTGSVSGNVLTFTKGDATTFTLTVATGSGGGSTFSNPSVESISGSLLLTANTFTSGSANLLHLTASAQNQANLVFKNNNTTGDTIISGSNNIFTNPATPTTGYTRYIGGSNNLYLNSTNGINSQITQSAASVSGNRPTMNNNIFNSIGNFSINQAVNTGDHSYSQNYISGNGNVTINALSHTGSLGLNHNVLSFGSITINASSASVAQIATGISGSGTINVNGNLIQGNGSMTITSPRFLLPTNTQSSLGNFVAGGSITVTNISSSAAVTANNNFGNSVISYTNAGAAGLGLHTLAGGFSQNVGGATLIASASSMNFNFNTTSGNNLTVTNQAWSGSLGVGQFNILRNIFYGQSGILLITGSVDGTGNTTGAFTDNAVIGKSNTIFSNQSGAGLHNSFISNVVGGEQLIISASNSFNSTIGGGAYFGRYNANDGVRNKTGQTVFSVGTGNSTARKTGLLIDSGSNTFVEGTLNVSGSSAFTGSVKIAPTFQLNLPTGSNQQAGTAVLDGGNPGTVTVSNSLVTADSIIMLTKQTLTNTHMVAVSSKGAGTFTITSNGNGDADTVGWFIINNS